MVDDRDETGSGLTEELQALPRARAPGRLLEERTVRTLKARGLLTASGFPRSWMAAAAAAAVALFAGGFAAGEWAAARGVTSAVMAERDQTVMEAAQMVQRTGSAYVLALATLASLADSSPNGALDQGREAAKAALYAAAGELASLDPDDPIAVQLRRYLAGAEPVAGSDPHEIRSVVWF